MKIWERAGVEKGCRWRREVGEWLGEDGDGEIRKGRHGTVMGRRGSRQGSANYTRPHYTRAMRQMPRGDIISSW